MHLQKFRIHGNRVHEKMILSLQTLFFHKKKKKNSRRKQIAMAVDFRIFLNCHRDYNRREIRN